MSRHLALAGLAASLLLLATPALASPDHAAHADIGAPGTATATTRLVEITAGDNFFEPALIKVKPGETIRLRIRNTGELLHDFSLGTAPMIAAHQKMMAMMMDHGKDHPGMAGHGHDGADGSVLIEPGKTAELVWTFKAVEGLEFACTLPGHYEAGMAGKVVFE